MAQTSWCSSTRSPPSAPSVRSRTTSRHITHKIPVFRRVIVIVLDSVGIGELPDAAAYGDQGSDTLGNIARLVPLKIPTLRSLGLGKVAALGGAPADPA